MKYGVIDLHCDTMPAMRGWARRSTRDRKPLDHNELQIDLEKLERGGYLCQCFSLFTHLGMVKELGETPFSYVNQLADFWQEEIGRYPDRIRQVRSWEELCKNREKGRVSAVMTVEEGGVYEGKLENLHRLYDRGVRISTITWNYPNELGYPNPKMVPGQPMSPDRTNGLTSTGIEFIREMERIGVVIDLSHLNDRGIWDVFENTKGPVIASHSNARGECAHLRNLDDDMIREIAKRGGVMGINFCPPFLTGPFEGDAETAWATAADMVRHMKYIRRIGGAGCLALGTDFDGFAGKVEIRDAGDMQKLADVMSLEGFTTGEIEQVFSGNALRVFREVWKQS